MGTPSENLFIGDLPGDMTEEKVRAIFSAYGTINSLRLNGVSPRGNTSAVISFGSVDEATWIVQNLNGNIPQGLATPILAQFKQPRNHGSKGGDMGWKGGGKGDMGWGGGMDMGWGAPKGGKGMDGGKGVDTPSDTLFIGDLPVGCDSAQLQSVFGAYGTVVSHTFTAPGTSGKLAAIVTFGSVDEATWIVNNLNGNIPQGFTEPIAARFKRQGGGAKGKGKGWDAGYGGGWDAGWGGDWGMGGKGGGAWGGGKGGGVSGPSDSLFIADLPQDIDEATLTSIFSAYGTIKSQKIMPPGASGAAAIVSFASVEEAKWLVDNLNGNIPQGLSTPVKVRFKESKYGKGGPYGK
eukprot:TRINITY_DN426_c0_g1_i1.p2 TRINITY_DN426_c0_g1~~TRINITY_DN426_c0_g1_i1.p2  ORF type:complete len:350 (-),score=85.38 TRINITY_DN426_c0_g1_i1:376-1425(-)